MKLKSVQIQNYRSIVNSGIVEIEEAVTVLVGKNEQGKTNFVKAIASFNSEFQYAPSDLPNHLRPTLEGNDARTIPIVTLWLVPSPAERTELKDVVQDIEKVRSFKVVRFFDGSFKYWMVLDDAEQALEISPPDVKPLVDKIVGQAEDLRKKLASHASRFPAFAPSVPQANAHIDGFVKANFGDYAQIDNLARTFATALKGLPNQDAAIQEAIVATAKEIQTTQAEIRRVLGRQSLSTFEEKMPTFIFHSSSHGRIPNEVNVATFVADPVKVSEGMANLCGAAGLSTQKIKELASSTDTSARETYEDHYRGAISGGINEFWTQTTYTVHFRIERERLSVSISDSAYSPRIPPSDRSDGFQWYLSFYSALLNEVSATEPIVLLLDNPGLELHSDGQHDIKKFLEEKMAPTTQIIYVTHSPAMVDPYNLEQVRKVELLPNNQGTKVGKLVPITNGFDLLEPVRTALGTRLVSSLVFNNYNVLVEGAADKPILEGAFLCLKPDQAKTILINGSIAESKDNFLARFYQRTGLPFVIYLDADSSGKELFKSLKNSGIDEDKIVPLGSLLDEIGFGKGMEFELESLISPEFYFQAIQVTYPNIEVGPPKTAVSKQSKYYEDLFESEHQIGFNKRRVGEAIKKMLAAGKADKQTLERLSVLTQRIWDALERQTTPKSQPTKPSRSTT